MSHVEFVGQRFLCLSLQDASARVGVYQLDGQPAGKIELPAIGTATGFRGHANRRGNTLLVRQFHHPADRLSLRSVQRHQLARPCSTHTFEPSDYQVDQVFCSGHDGTRIGVLRLLEEGFGAQSAPRPTLCTATAGRHLGSRRRFRTALASMEMGGVYAVANLRGSREYREAWHAAGTRDSDTCSMISSRPPSRLVDQKYTRSDQLRSKARATAACSYATVMLPASRLVALASPKCRSPTCSVFSTSPTAGFWVTDYGSL